MPFDFLIDKNTGDIVFEDGDISLVSSNQRRVRQEIELTLKTFQGEWFHDINFGGINKEILYSKTSTKSEVDAWFKSIITSFPEVVRLTSFESEYNINTRDYDVNFSVLTTEGPLDVKVRPDLEVVYRQFIAEIITPTCGAKIISAVIAGESVMSAFIGTLVASGAVISGEATLTALVGKSYAGQAVSGDSAMNVGMMKVISASLGGFSTFSTNLYKNISVSSISGTSTFMSAIYSYIQSAIQGQATVTANIAKVIAAVINDNQSVLSATSSNAMGAIITGQATLTSTMMRVFSSIIADNNSNMTVSFSRLMTASLTGSDSSMNVIIRKRIQSSINDNQGNVSANINRALSMVVSGQGAMSSSVRKLLSSTLVEFPANITVNISKPGASVIGGSDTSTFAIYKIKPIASAIVESPATFTASIGRVLGANISQTSTMAGVFAWAGDVPQMYDEVLRQYITRGDYWKLTDPDFISITSGQGWRNQFLRVYQNGDNLYGSGITSSTPISRIPEAKSVIWDNTTNYVLAGDVQSLIPSNMVSSNQHFVFFLQTSSSFGASEDLITLRGNMDYEPVLGEGVFSNPIVKLRIRSDRRVDVVFSYSPGSGPDRTITYTSNVLLTTNKRYFVRFTIRPSFLGTGNGIGLFLDNVQVAFNAPVITNSFDWNIFRPDDFNTYPTIDSLSFSGMNGFKLERMAYFEKQVSLLQEAEDFTGLYRIAVNPSYDKGIMDLNPLCYLPLDQVLPDQKIANILQLADSNGPAVIDSDSFVTTRTTVPQTSPISGYTDETSIPFVDSVGSLAAGGIVGGNHLVSGTLDISGISNEYSICFWHRAANQSSYSVPFYLWRTVSLDSSSSLGFLQRTSSNYVFNFERGVINFPLTSLQVGVDSFVVCKVNISNQTASVWVNGVLISSTVVSPNWSNSSVADSSIVRIDSEYPFGISYMVGTSGNAYERFAILPVDLTQAQIQELYRIGNKW